MALPQGTTTNNSGIDPGANTYLTEIVKTTEAVRIEANDNAGAFQESNKLRSKITHRLSGYGAPSLTAGLNGKPNISDGPFVDSVEKQKRNEDLDRFAIEGHEFVNP